MLEYEGQSDLEREFNNVAFTLETLLAEPLIEVDEIVRANEDRIRARARKEAKMSVEKSVHAYSGLEMFEGPISSKSVSEWEQFWHDALSRAFGHDLSRLRNQQIRRNHDIRRMTAELNREMRKYLAALKMKDTGSAQQRTESLQKQIKLIRESEKIKPLYDDVFSREKLKG